MASVCPHCGREVEHPAQSARVVRGPCEECGGEFTILTVLAEGAAPAGGATAEPGAEGETAASRGPSVACASCGSSLVLHVLGDGGLEGTCSGCSSIYTYSLTAGPGVRPARPMERGGREDRGPRDRFSSNARPCRECGAPLRFTTGDDGFVTGECTSCGNRFKLPPRRDRPEGGRRPSGGGGFRPRFGGGGGRGFDRRGGGSGGGSFRRGPPRRRDAGSSREGDDDERPRRRRRSDDE